MELFYHVYRSYHPWLQKETIIIIIKIITIIITPPQDNIQYCNSIPVKWRGCVIQYITSCAYMCWGVHIIRPYRHKTITLCAQDNGSRVCHDSLCACHQITQLFRGLFLSSSKWSKPHLQLLEEKKTLKGFPLDLFNMHCVAYRNTIQHKWPPVWRTNDWEKSKHPFSGPGVNADNSEHTCRARSVCHCLLSRKTFHLLRRGGSEPASVALNFMSDVSGAYLQPRPSVPLLAVVVNDTAPWTQRR